MRARFALPCLIALAAAPPAFGAFGGAQSLTDTDAGGFGVAGAGATNGAQLLVVRAYGRIAVPHLFERPAGAATFTDAGALPGADTRSNGAVVAAAAPSAAGVAWRQDSPRKYSAIKVLLREPFGGLVEIAGPAAGGVRYPALGVDSLLGAVVAYSTGTNTTHLNQRGRVAIAIRRPGEAWRRPRIVTSTNAGPPAVAVAPNGRAIVAWIRNRRIEVVSIDNGQIGRVKTLGPASSKFSIAIGNAGRAVVAWQQRAQRHVIIRASTRARRGTFSRPRTLGRPVYARDVATAVNDDGRALVAWNEEDFSRTRERRPFGYNGIYARVFAAIGSTRGARFAKAAAISPGYGYAGTPRVAAVGNGFAAAWFYRYSAENSGVTGTATLRGGGWERSQGIGPELLQTWEAGGIPLVIGAGSRATAFWSQGVTPAPQQRLFFADARIE